MSEQQNDVSQSNAMDEIPVEELIRITREFTRRITNQDRQRLAVDLRESGHQRTIQLTAPITLQQFFSGEIDLDTEMALRFLNAPLVSHIRFSPRLGESVRRQATAIASSQDDAMAVTFDTYVASDSEVAMEVTFTLYSSLALHFTLNALEDAYRSRWLDLMRRENGITFLWTRERWEQPYLIFVVREYFVRLYAFSPSGVEAAVRITPDVITALLDWLGELWFPGVRQAPPPQAETPLKSLRPQYATDFERPATLPPDAAPHFQEEEPPLPPEPEPGDGEEELPPSDLEW